MWFGGQSLFYCSISLRGSELPNIHDSLFLVVKTRVPWVRFKPICLLLYTENAVLIIKIAITIIKTLYDWIDRSYIVDVFTNMGVSTNGIPLNHPNFNDIFHYKPIIWRHPHWRKPPWGDPAIVSGSRQPCRRPPGEVQIQMPCVDPDGFHSHGNSPIAGWFMSWKIHENPNREYGWFDQG